MGGADADLFEGAAWVLTPTAATDLDAFTRLQTVIGSLGADVIVLSASDHDRLVAVVSHVPHLVAATLMNAAAAGAEQDGALLRLAAGGFRDMTRVAAGHPGIWPDICAENAPAIVGALDALLAELAVMRERGLHATGKPYWESCNRPVRPAVPCSVSGRSGPSISPSCVSPFQTARECWPKSRPWPLTQASAFTT